MKTTRKWIALIMAACILLSIPISARAEEPAEDYDTLFEQADQNKADHQEVIHAFFSNPGHFIRALAYHTGSARYDIRNKINQHMTDSQEKAAYYLLELLATAPYGDSLSKSEEDLIDFFLIDRESNRLTAKHGEQKHWPDYKAAILEQMNSDRAAAAENIAAAIVFNNIEFVWNLANESAQVQEQFVSLLGDIEYYYTQLAVIRSLHYLIHSEVDSTIPEYPEYSVYPGIKKEHVELILTILDRLPDVPWPVLAYRPDPEELEQWLAAPDYPDMDINYPALIAGMAESGGLSAETKKTLVNAALLDTDDFIRALAQEQQEVQQLVLQHMANEDTPHETVNALCEVFRVHAAKEDLLASEKQLVQAAENHILKIYGKTLGTARPIPELMEEILDAYMDNEALLEQLVYSICADPLQFAKALVAVSPQDCTDIYYKLKWRVNTQLRQNMLDVVYSAMETAANTTGMSPEEWEVLEAFLDHQGQTPLALYPYGVDPNPTQPTAPPISPTTPTGPLFSTMPATKPGTIPTEPTETTEETEPVTDGVPEEDPPADTRWISTVCIILGFLCISIVLGSSLAKKKKAPEAPSPEAAAQPEMPPAVQVFCPAPLEQTVQQQITAVLQQRYDAYSVHWYSEKNAHGICRCYGTEGDCHILFYAGGFRMEEKTCRTVGGQTFCFGTSFELYAYKQGVLTDLATALEQGLVSIQAVKEARKHHDSIS